MAGIQIDGVNNKIDFDDDADTSISSASDDTLVVEVGGNTLATVTATSVTVNDGVEITTADNTDTLTLTSTDADANAGPNLRLYRNSSSAAPNDVIGVIEIEGRNDNSEDIVYQQYQHLIADETDGTEDGYLLFNQMKAGTLTERYRIETGTFVINDPGNDFDTRIEGNNEANLFFVDASVDGVGIGTATPNPFRLLVDHDDSNNGIAKFNHSNATPEGIRVVFSAAAPDNTSATFLECTDSSATRFQIQAQGNAQNHDNSYGQISDERIKSNIKDANSQWDDIKSLKVRNFERKDDIEKYGEGKKVQIGLIAQECELVSPKLVNEQRPSAGDIRVASEFGTLYEDGDTIPEGKERGDIKEVKEQVKAISYSVLYMKAIKALQEAMAKIETLETKVKALEEA